MLIKSPPRSNSSALNRLFPVDLPLFVALLVLCGISLIVIYSSGGENIDLLKRQSLRIGFAFVVLLFFTRIPPQTLERVTPYIYFAGLVLLIIVLAAGFKGKGATRWINLGVVRFQPAEVMKIAVPMMIAWVLTRSTLPSKLGYLLVATALVALPAFLIYEQPDLGTAILIAASGLLVIFLAGISWKIIIGLSVLAAAFMPLAWSFLLHPYQQRRILTLLDPWADPLGDGYHSIQSIIAIGSGGVMGKGWLLGTQSQLEFIPERSTDFIFSVLAEEFGLVGIIILLSLYLFVVMRSLVIAFSAKDTYSKLLAGSLSMTFFLYIFVNIGMVSGMLPVVGVPLPLISYGGTSMVTLMVGFGILMSIQGDKKLISK